MVGAGAIEEVRDLRRHWALLQRRSLEEVLIEVANLGGDADTTAAVAGGLLGARDGLGAVPGRWVERLEYRQRLAALVPGLLAARCRPYPSDSRSN